MHFDMGRAWNEAVAKVGANFSLLAILGGVFFFVPAVILYLAMPELLDLSPMMPTGDPEATARLMENLAPTLLPLATLVLIANLVGYCAMIALLGDKRRVSVGEAIGVGFKALLPLIGVMILFVLAYLVCAIAAGLVVGGIVAALAMVSQGLAYSVAILLVVAIVVGLILVCTRLSLMLPVVALEGTVNPLKAIRRSWSLTRPVQWRLLGFYLLFFIAYFVVAIVLFIVMGLIAAALATPAALGFLNGLAGAVVAIVFSGLLVGIYRQLAGPSAQAVDGTFE
jgi:hypothetical protein